MEKIDLKIKDAVMILYVRKLRLPSTDFFLKPIRKVYVLLSNGSSF